MASHESLSTPTSENMPPLRLPPKPSVPPPPPPSSQPPEEVRKTKFPSKAPPMLPPADAPVTYAYTEAPSEIAYAAVGLVANYEQAYTTNAVDEYDEDDFEPYDHITAPSEPADGVYEDDEFDSASDNDDPNYEYAASLSSTDPTEDNAIDDSLPSNKRHSDALNTWQARRLRWQQEHEQWRQEKELWNEQLKTAPVAEAAPPPATAAAAPTPPPTLPPALVAFLPPASALATTSDANSSSVMHNLPAPMHNASSTMHNAATSESDWQTTRVSTAPLAPRDRPPQPIAPMSSPHAPPPTPVPPIAWDNAAASVGESTTVPVNGEPAGLASPKTSVSEGGTVPKLPAGAVPILGNFALATKRPAASTAATVPAVPPIPPKPSKIPPLPPNAVRWETVNAKPLPTPPSTADSEDAATTPSTRRQTVLGPTAVTGGEQIHELMQENVVKEGFLAKKGGRRHNWKIRWFVLKHTYLAYYKDKHHSRESSKPLGQMVLAKSEVEAGITKYPFSFGVRTPKRTYYLNCQDTKERREWMEAIRECIKLQKGAHPALTTVSRESIMLGKQ